MSHTWRFTLTDGREMSVVGNGDLSGDVEIVRTDGESGAVHGPKIPGELLRQFALEWVGMQLASRFQDGGLRWMIGDL